MKTGKVWLVGAGPGDPGLLTVKAIETIKEADVIVYDALIGDALYSLFPRDVEYISVGKRAGNHTMPQDKIDRILSDELVPSEPTGDSNGIGLSNVISRLDLHYNVDNIFNIYSDGENKGTEVIIRIPMN